MGRQNSAKAQKIYRITLGENDTHKTLFALKFSKAGAIVSACTVVVVFIALIYSVIVFTPLRRSIPGYPDADAMAAAVTNVIKIDSLESAVTRWELYAKNLSRVLSEDPPVAIDSSVRANAIRYISGKSLGELAAQDSLLKTIKDSEEQFELSYGAKRDVPIEGMHFFTPIKGVVIRGFDPINHPGLDVKAPKGTVAYSIYDGTVVYSGWDDQRGNVIVVQHAHNVISIYEHGERLLRKIGDSVSAGTPVALTGNGEALSQDEYLHFSLWYNGEAQDPTRYISF